MYDKYNKMRDDARQRLATALQGSYAANQQIADQQRLNGLNTASANGLIQGASLGSMAGPQGALIGGAIGGGLGILNSLPAKTKQHGGGFSGFLGGLADSVVGTVTALPGALGGSPATPMLAQNLSASGMFDPTPKDPNLRSSYSAEQLAEADALNKADDEKQAKRKGNNISQSANAWSGSPPPREAWLGKPQQ